MQFTKARRKCSHFAPLNIYFGPAVREVSRRLDAPWNLFAATQVEGLGRGPSLRGGRNRRSMSAEGLAFLHVVYSYIVYSAITRSARARGPKPLSALGGLGGDSVPGPAAAGPS